MNLNQPIPITRDLILLGGGHTHALVLQKWAMAPLPGVQVTLVNPDPKAPYTGMLPGYVAGHYQRDDLDIDLVKLARRAGARLIIDRAIDIDRTAKRVKLANRPDVSYDTLSIDIGITSAITPGQSKLNVIPAKPLGPFANAWSDYLDEMKQASTARDIKIIGAGVAGVELALAMAHRLRLELIKKVTITLIETGSAPLRELHPSSRKTLLSDLDSAGIRVEVNASFEELTSSGDFVVSSAGAAPYAWLTNTGLVLHDGYIAVNEHLQSAGDPVIFAAGDCAHLAHAPRPKAGVFAVRAAPILFDNLQAQLSGGAVKSFHPQKSYLKLISRGAQSAVSDKWGIALAGKWVWRWKDRIDKAFMNKFRHGREMPKVALPERVALGVKPLLGDVEMPCGACGAKVAQVPLQEGLNPDLGTSSLDDAAIVKTDGRTEVFTSDHLRAFSPDAFTLAKVAAIHALGDIWSMGGRPKTVLSQIILPPLSPDKQSAMIREIAEGADEVFSALGTRIAGGHTSAGQELTVGFSISGSLDHPPIMHSGASAGDILILTKPIGGGVLLAAEMRQLADGDEYQIALKNMCRMQATASQLLSNVATAMTDVTGFGLAGHLLNILRASQLSARLYLDQIPVLPGAARLSAQGVRSSLWQANAEQARFISGIRGSRADLLFDPQTCGGMLAAIPKDEWRKVRDAFAAAQEPIWQIGELGAGPAHIELRTEQ